MARENGETAELAFIAEVPIRLAMSQPDSTKWIQSMASKVSSIIHNDTWDITDRPENQNIIGSRFVLRNKVDHEGSNHRKARLVARGFSQRPGTEFNETYAPVARLSSIRLVTSIAAQRNMTVRQFDITTAYLNGTLEEDVFMEVPDYLEDVLRYIKDKGPAYFKEADKAKSILETLSQGDKVCKLRKALYGLRQAGRAWNKRLDAELRNFGAIPSKADPCVYIKGQGKDLLISHLCRRHDHSLRKSRHNFSPMHASEEII